MSKFDHPGLMQDINECWLPFRKRQPGTIKGWGQSAPAVMFKWPLITPHKELMALAIGASPRCSGRIGFHAKALIKRGGTWAELDEMLAVCVYRGGGPALMYAAEFVKAWHKLLATQG